MSKDTNITDKDIYPRKLSFLDKIILKYKFPVLPNSKKGNSFFVIVRRNRYQLLENIADRLKGYLTNLKMNFDEIQNLKDDIKNIEKKLDIKEEQRRKIAGKVGGLTKSLNKANQKNADLLKNREELLNTIELRDLQMELIKIQKEKSENEVKILKNRGKKKDIETYKNFFECRHELEKREREYDNKISERQKK